MCAGRRGGGAYDPAPPPAHPGTRSLGLLAPGAPTGRAPRAGAACRPAGRPTARGLAGRRAPARPAASTGRALHLHLADVALLVDVVEPAVLALHAAARDLLLAVHGAPAPSRHARAAHVSPLVEEVEPSLLPADAGLRDDVGHSAFSPVLVVRPARGTGRGNGGRSALLPGVGEPHAPTGR